jgi:hypothetical protein
MSRRKSNLSYCNFTPASGSRVSTYETSSWDLDEGIFHLYSLCNAPWGRPHGSQHVKPRKTVQRKAMAQRSGDQYCSMTTREGVNIAALARVTRSPICTKQGSSQKGVYLTVPMSIPPLQTSEISCQYFKICLIPIYKKFIQLLDRNEIYSWLLDTMERIGQSRQLKSLDANKEAYLVSTFSPSRFTFNSISR